MPTSTRNAQWTGSSTAQLPAFDFSPTAKGEMHRILEILGLDDRSQEGKRRAIAAMGRVKEALRWYPAWVEVLHNRPSPESRLTELNHLLKSATQTHEKLQQLSPICRVDIADARARFAKKGSLEMQEAAAAITPTFKFILSVTNDLEMLIQKTELARKSLKQKRRGSSGNTKPGVGVVVANLNWIFDHYYQGPSRTSKKAKVGFIHAAFQGWNKLTPTPLKLPSTRKQIQRILTSNHS